jgi:penicillin-binding protein 2
VVQGADFAQRAEQNRIKVEPLPATRGVIYDRNGEILARNTPQGREYPLKAAAAHVIGYIGEADEAELASFAVELGALVGKLGVEREEDKLLRGSDGGVIRETDPEGKPMRELSRNEPIPGQDIHVFLDSRLQEAAFAALADQKGAIVATSPEGEVLALASSPSFDPNVFSRQKPTANDEQKEIAQILSDPNQPMFDRAIGGQYAPGSTFKIVTGTAGLETGVIDTQEEIEDTGEIKIGEFRFGNWYFDQYGRKEGMVNILKAFQRSNDIYFYRVGERLGITKLAAWARAFGLGKPTEIPLKGEAAGLVPDAGWKETVKHDSWYLGDTYITAIGQGDLQTTPIQVNRMAAVIASSGKLCRSQLVNEGKNPQCESVPIKAETIETIREGMKRACETGGTGWPLFNFRIKNQTLSSKVDSVDFFHEASDSARQNSSGNLDGQADMVRIPVACKTGTAEYGDPQDKTHAWFTVFAPVHHPEIVVTVLLEGAGQGSDKAAPVAKKILETWFEEQ